MPANDLPVPVFKLLYNAKAAIPGVACRVMEPARGIKPLKISNNQKDRSLISIYYNDQLQVERIKKSDIGYCTVKLLAKKNLIDQEMFNFLRNDKSCSNQLLKLKEEATETEIKYSKYRLKDEAELLFNHKGYYVARNWGKSNIHKFIDKLTTKVPQLKYEVHD